jgi:putative nucleotidyltransferase with HDIG domain
LRRFLSVLYSSLVATLGWGIFIVLLTSYLQDLESAPNYTLLTVLAILLVLAFLFEFEIGSSILVSLGVAIQVAIVAVLPLEEALLTLALGTVLGLTLAREAPEIPRPVYAYNNTGIALVIAYLVRGFLIERVWGDGPIADGFGWVAFRDYTSAYLIFVGLSGLILLVWLLIRGLGPGQSLPGALLTPVLLEALMLPASLLICLSITEVKSRNPLDYAGLVVVALPLIGASAAMRQLDDWRRDLDRRMRNLSRLHMLLLRIAKPVETRRLLLLVRDAALSVINPQQLRVCLLDSKKANLDFVHEVVNGEELPPRSKPKSSGLEGLVMRDAGPVVITGRKEGLRPPLGPDPGEPVPRSYLGVPLKSGGKPVGVIAVASDRPGAYTGRDQELLSTLAGNASETMDNWEKLQELRRDLNDTVQVLVRIVEAQDESTIGHSDRVARYAELICRKLELDEGEIRNVRLGALLHDVGKIDIPSRVFKAGRRLTVAERELVRRSPIRSADIIREIPQLEDVVQIVTQHRERLDGSGAPAGLRGDEICRGAKIVAVAEVYEALSSPRPYRERLSREQALIELTKVAGKELDAEVVEALAAALEQIPAGAEEFAQ